MFHILDKTLLLYCFSGRKVFGWIPKTFTLHSSVTCLKVVYHMSLHYVSSWQTHCHFCCSVSWSSCCLRVLQCNHRNRLYNLSACSGENMEQVRCFDTRGKMHLFSMCKPKWMTLCLCFRIALQVFTGPWAYLLEQSFPLKMWDSFTTKCFMFL